MEFLKEALVKIQDDAAYAGINAFFEQNEIPRLIVPEDCRTLDLSSLLPPTFIREELEFSTPESFVSYVQRYFDPERTVIFVNREGFCVSSTLDYHPVDGDPARCQHSASFTARTTQHYQDILKQNGRFLSQEDFADFLEDHEDIVVKPELSDLLSTVRHIRMTSNASFERRINHKTGAINLAYSEDDGTGSLNVPDTITFSIPPFEGTDCSVVIKANVRVRIKDKKPHLCFKIPRLEERVAKQVFAVSEEDSKSVLDQIKEGLPDAPFFEI